MGQLRKALSPEGDPPSPRRSSLCHCSALPPSGLAQRELHSSPSSYKAGDPERDRLSGQNVSSYTRKALGDLVPWVSSCPVPRQGATSLSLPLRSSKAAQGVQTQHGLEESDVPGGAHSRFTVVSNCSRNPPSREGPPSDREDLRTSQSSVPGLHSLRCA